MFLKSFLKTLLLISVLAGPSFSQSKNLREKVFKKIDSLFSPFNTSPGYAVGIFRNQEKFFVKGYGFANLDYNIPITENTVFNIASLSKQFTAACIAILIQKGSISLEDEVSKYIPEVSKYANPIRIKHLIYFSSGLHEYFNLPHRNGLNWQLFDYFTIDTAIAASLSQKNLEFQPGDKWSYSNVNYMLLAKIVEKVTGKTLNEFAQENLFKPLKMNSSEINDDVTVIIKNRATGYVPRSVELREDAQKSGYYLRQEGEYVQCHRNSPHYGGSGMFTSIRDWYLWDKNFYDKRVGGEKFYELMHTRIKLNHEKNNDAFGLVFGEYNNEEIIWYAGGDIGFNSFFMRFPKQQITVVCFSNLGIGGNAEKMAKQVVDILIEGKILITSNRN